MAKVNPVPEGYHTVTPYLIVEGADQAIEFYTKAFKAEEKVRMPGPDGKVMHAEIAIGNSIVMLSDAMDGPGGATRGPKSLGGSPITILLYVDDVDAWAKRAQEAGAKVVRPVEDQFYGDRAGTFEDPFGHMWDIHTHTEDVSPEEMEKRMAAMAPA